MNSIKCILLDNGSYPELDGLELYLPAIPVKGDSNLDITHKKIVYNCSVVDIDWIIKELHFKHCFIYITAA